MLVETGWSWLISLLPLLSPGCRRLSGKSAGLPRWCELFVAVCYSRGVLFAVVRVCAVVGVSVLGGGAAGLKCLWLRVAGADVTVFDVDGRGCVISMRWREAAGRGFRVRLAVREACGEPDFCIDRCWCLCRNSHLVDHEMVLGMVPGSVLVDVAVDQGGKF